MSSRPRFAGDGRLRLPEGLVVSEARRRELVGAVSARLGPETYDPFERVGGELLLTEAFTRLDLTPSEELLRWFERHGVLALETTLPSETRRRPGSVSGQPLDQLVDVAVQQANVRWHLESIAHLSDHLVPLPGRDAGVPWEARWAQPVLAVGEGYRWLGGEEWPDRDLLAGMQRSAIATGERDPMMPLEEWREWWRRGHASWQRILEEGVPVVHVVGDGGAFDPVRRHPSIDALIGGDPSVEVGSGPWDLVELQHRLMAPYVAVAGAHRVEIGWPEGADHATEPHPPLAVHERRTWDSLLAPVYVQLLEGLRRVTEGVRGAAFCKECGQPFLTLDARRSAFCNDRERYRYGQREFRRRASEAQTATP